MDCCSIPRRACAKLFILARVSPLCLVFVLVGVFLHPFLHAAAPIGLDELRAREPALDGTGVAVAMIEAESGGNYRVNPAAPGLASGSFTYFDSNNPFPSGSAYNGTLVSGHANNVAANFFGLTSGTLGYDGVAPGVDSIGTFEALYHANNIVFLNVSTSYEIVNQSFIFSILDDEIDRVYDWYSDFNGTLFVNGAGTTGSAVQSTGSMYNAISVGVLNVAMGSLPDGRSKPDIVATGSQGGQFTSYTTPLVSGSAAILVQAAARGDAGSGVSTQARDPRTLKALLLTGATKTSGWSQTPTRPLDSVNGAGLLNINRSHMLLSGGAFDPAETTSQAPGANHLPPAGLSPPAGSQRGWAFETITNPVGPGFIRQDATHHYLLEWDGTESDAFDLTVTLVWNRQVNRVTINDLDLFVYDEGDNLVASSVSTVDNVEHLYLEDLPTGSYVVQAHKNASGLTTTSEDYALAFFMEAVAVPAAPTGLIATPTATDTIELQWNDESVDETGFRISLRETGSGAPFAEAGAVAEDVDQFVVSGLEEGQPYDFELVAFNAGGESIPVTVTASTLARPAAPTDFAVVTVTGDSVSLQWVDTSDNETAFKIERADSGSGSFVLVADLPSESTAFSDTGLTPGSGYDYRLSSVNEAGNSGFVLLTVTTVALPEAPTSVNAEPSSPGAIDVSWIDTSSDETGFIVEFSAAGLGEFSVAENVGPDLTFAQVSGLEAGETVDIRVGATNVAGTTYSDVVQATAWTGLESWRFEWFGTVSSAGDSANEADPNSDGEENVVEYATGQSPFSSSIAVRMEPFGVRGFEIDVRTDDPTLDVTLGVSVGGPSAFVDESISLVNADASDRVDWLATDPLGGPFERHRYSIIAGTPSETVFLRVQATSTEP